MRNSSIVVIALIVGFACLSVSAEEKSCVPGSTFLDDEQCNTCFCGEDGKTVSCTKKRCIKLPVKRDVSKKCEPGTRYLDSDGCNWCTCNFDGTGAACTRKFCVKRQSAERNARDTAAVAAANTQVCVPNSTFLDDQGCNTCRCNEEGTLAACTLKYCFNPNNNQ